MPRRPVRREGAAGRERGRRRSLRWAAGALKERGRAEPASEERSGELWDPPRAPCVPWPAGSGAERPGGRAAAAADGEPATPGRRRSRSGRKRRGTVGPGWAAGPRAMDSAAAGASRGGGAAQSQPAAR